LRLSASTEDRLRALYQLLEEKLVKRSVSLKSLDPGKIEEASQGTARQKVALKAGITQDVGKQINKMVKEMGVKNLSSSIQVIRCASPANNATTSKGDCLLQGVRPRGPPAVHQLPD